MNDVCFIFCGYHDPRVIICGNEDLESWLEVACKEKTLAYSMEEWMVSDGVVVIKGTVLDNVSIESICERT